MDKFWINKLRELKTALDRHLFEKTRFESRHDRTSLQDLRTGQKLKREGENLCSQFAQLAEFATGVPSDKFNFRLEQKARYIHSSEGGLFFGPAALIDSPPYVAFDVRNLFGGQSPQKPKDQEAGKKADLTPQKSIADHITDKFSATPYIHLNLNRFTKLKPAQFDRQADKVVSNVSKIDKYISAITSKFILETKADSEAPRFFIYEGEFVYLTRRGRWAAVRTRILTQKDYFQPSESNRKPTSRQLPKIEPDSYLEPEDVVEYITDDLAEPIASPSSDLGLGYFVPTRRMGQSQPALLQTSRKPKIAGQPESAPVLPVIPLLGSPEFAQDILNKTQAVDMPIGEIGPAFVNRTGRKAERARSFAAVLRGRLTLPKSETVRKAVVALLPAMEALIRRSQTEEPEAEDSLAVMERQFDRMVQAQIKSFRVASRTLGQSKVSPIMQAGKIESIFSTPVVDSLGLFGKYLPDEVKSETSMGLLAARAEKSVSTIEQGQSISEMIRSFSVGGRPSLEKEFEDIQLAGVPDATGKVSKGISGVLGKILTSLIKSRSAQVFPTMKPALPGELAASVQSTAKAQSGKGSAQEFSGNILEKIAGSGIAAGVSSKFRELLEPDKLFSSLLSQRESRTKIGKLLKPDDLGKLAKDILTVDKLEKAKDKLPAGGKEPGKILSSILSAAKEPEALGAILKPGGLGMSLGAVKPKDMIAALAMGAGGGEKALKPGAKVASLFRKIFKKDQTEEAETEISKKLPAGLKSIVKKVAGKAGISGSIAGKAEKLAESILGGIPAGTAGAGIASGMASALSGKSPVGALSAAIGQGRGALSSASQSAGVSPMSMLGSASEGVRQGAAGMMSGRADQMAAGSIGRASAFMGRTPQMGLNIPAAQNIPQLPNERPEIPSLTGAMGSMAQIGAARMPEMKLPMNVIGTASSGTESAAEIPFKAGLALPSISKSPKLPKGWDRPPFEVGDAISKHLKTRADRSPELPSRPRASRLEDYGLSVIDLEEAEAAEYASPLQQYSEAANLEIDDATMDQIYFRLKRILETEDERAGGES